MAAGRARRTAEPEPSQWHRSLADMRALSALRAEARELMAGCQVSATAVDAVLLALTELATNGLEAAGPAGFVQIHLDCSRPAVVSLVVSNEPVTRPVTPDGRAVTMPGPEAERGRGLPLVAALAMRLSIDNDDRSTNVRADFAR